MAESVVSSVGQTIGKLFIDEAKFLWAVEGKVKDLQKELKLIQCLLGDADARREDSQAVREWVGQLQDIAYDAEDVIERYILRVAPKKEENIIKAYACFVAKCTWVQAYVVGKEIAGLKSSISNLKTSMQDYGIRKVNEGERKGIGASMPKRTYAHFEEDFVGREDSIKELVKELLKDGEQHRVISICGMGGLGKTTLAKKVFAHDEVNNHFDGFAWACISQEYNVRDILEGILVKLIPDQRERVTKMKDDELLENLYKTQKQRRCIVVLDDIWTKQAWDGLRDAFPVKSTRSKLVITTRNREVAEYIDPQGFFYEPRCLSDEQSWELLMKRAFPKTKGLGFGLSSVGPRVGQHDAAEQAVEGITRQLEMEGQRQVITKDMKMLGDELLKKCGGLPLAIIVLGGLLAINDWETVSKKINSYFSDKSDVSKVLALSYDDLPWHLKPCFLYLGSFPEDAEIPATKVLRMWIAEGFVLLNDYEEEREIQVEDVAEQYLMELVNRGMVQVRFGLSGKIKTVHLHDVMQALCVSKAMQESFLSILNIQQNSETEDCSSSMAMKVESTRKMRRLSLNMRASDGRNMIPSLKPIRKAIHLRTLMFFGSIKGKGKQFQPFQPIFINCKFLRVLKLEDLYRMGGKLPESVGDLVHLRYLSLARSVIQGLPQGMGNLGCMEFLDLCVSKYVIITVPNVLWKMRRLRYLRLPLTFYVKKKFYSDRKMLRLDTLKNIRILRNFSSEYCDVNDVGKLTNLQKLTAYGTDKLEIIPHLSKFNLKHLQSLSFKFKGYTVTEGELSKMSSCHHSCKLSMFGEIDKFPEHKNLPQQLRKLVLVSSKLEEDPMPILEKLQHLVVLLLGIHAFVEKKMVCSAGGFPRLKDLLLYGLYNLEELRVAEGAMPHLSRLGISRCPNLKTLPPGVPTYDCSEYFHHEFDKHGDPDFLILSRFQALLRAQMRAESRESSLSLEASEESSINLGDEHETSDEGEHCNNEASLLEASEESSTNLA